MAVNTITLGTLATNVPTTQPLDGQSFPEITIIASQLDELRFIGLPQALLSDVVIQLISTAALNWHGTDSTGTNDYPIAADVPFDLRPHLRGGDTRSFYYTPAAGGVLRVLIGSLNSRLVK